MVLPRLERACAIWVSGQIEADKRKILVARASGIAGVVVFAESKDIESELADQVGFFGEIANRWFGPMAPGPCL